MSFLREGEFDSVDGGVLGVGGHRFRRILAGRQVQFLLGHFLKQTAFQVGQNSLGFQGRHAVVAQAELFSDHFLGLGEGGVTGVDLQIAIVNKAFLHGQGDEATAKSTVDGGETGGGDLLKNRHHEAECPALVPLPACQSESVHQVDLKGVVEFPLQFRHDKRLGVDPTASEQRRSIRSAGVGLGATENDRI